MGMVPDLVLVLVLDLALDLVTSSNHNAATPATTSHAGVYSHIVLALCPTPSALKMQPQTDHNGPLMVPAGTDKFRDIGRPRGVVDGNVPAGMEVRGGGE